MLTLDLPQYCTRLLGCRDDRRRTISRKGFLEVSHSLNFHEHSSLTSKISYFLKAIDWARKYGLRLLIDFHALPGESKSSLKHFTQLTPNMIGSQNGWNHSGKAGSVNWLYGVMGIANAQRSLETLRSIVEYISQDGIKQVVPMIGLVNEVQGKIVGQDVLTAL